MLLPTLGGLMPHFLLHVVLHGATRAEALKVEQALLVEGFSRTFNTPTHRYSLPGGAFHSRSADSLFAAKGRMLKALATTRFKEPAPDREGDTFASGTFSYYIIGPSITHKYLGLRKEPLAKSNINKTERKSPTRK
jgi:hypothetical protein